MITGLPATRQEATEGLLSRIQALTEPQRQREQERMLGTLAQRGLLGYGQTLPGVDGARRVSPLAESVLAAQEQGRAREALAAEQCLDTFCPSIRRGTLLERAPPRVGDKPQCLVISRPWATQVTAPWNSL